jgi:hypothetical protein
MTHRTINQVDRELGQARDRLVRYLQAVHNAEKNREEVKSTIARLESERKALTTRPEPVARNIAFVKRFGKVGGHEFHYAATSFTHEGTGQRLWSVTGKGFTKSVPWATVADFIDRHETDATRPKVQDLIPVTFHQDVRNRGDATRPKVQDLIPVTFHQDVRNRGEALRFSFDAETTARMRPSNPFNGQGHYEIFGGR